MRMEEFLMDGQKPAEGAAPIAETPAEPTEEEVIANADANIDVQKEVVASLAADNAEQSEQIDSLKNELSSLKADIEAFKAKIAALEKERNDSAASASGKSEEIAALKAELAALADQLLVNKEGELSNQVALLDRNVELPDRFPSETRDQVLEVIKDARDAAEADGRIRRAQLLEGVLVANQPSGALQAKREALKKLFIDNQNILSGEVINSLDKYGISYKNGEEYLLPAEILKRMY